MIMDYAVMANVIARPQDNVVADGGVRLKGVVFQDEAIVSNLRFRPNGSSGAYIADELVSFGFNLPVHAFAQAIHLPVGHGSKEGVIGSWIYSLDLFKRYDRQPFEGPTGGHVFCAYAEGDHLMLGVVPQVEVCERSKIGDSENDNSRH
jgi:hypothetical protein